MSAVKALNLRVGDKKESVYGGEMTVWAIDHPSTDARLVKWDLGVEMNYLLVEAYYSPERNPEFTLTNR